MLGLCWWKGFFLTVPSSSKIRFFVALKKPRDYQSNDDTKKRFRITEIIRKNHRFNCTWKSRIVWCDFNDVHTVRISRLLEFLSEQITQNASLIKYNNNQKWLQVSLGWRHVASVAKSSQQQQESMHVDQRERERVFVCFPDRGIKDRERVWIKIKKPKQQQNKKPIANSARVCLPHGKGAHKRE